MESQKQLTGRVFGSDDLSNMLIVMIEPSGGGDIIVRLVAPDTSSSKLAAMRSTLGDRMVAALVGLDDNWISQVDDIVEGELLVCVNYGGYKPDSSLANVVAKATEAILTSMEENYYKSIHALRAGQSLVVLDWDEPMNPGAHQFTLTIPAGVGIERPDGDHHREDPFKSHLEQMIDHNMSASVHVWYRIDGPTEISITSNRGQIAPRVASELIRRLTFIIKMHVKLPGSNNSPVVVLSSPFRPFVDDGSEPPEYVEF